MYYEYNTKEFRSRCQNMRENKSKHKKQPFIVNLHLMVGVKCSMIGITHALK